MNMLITLLPFITAVNLLFSGVLYFHGRHEKVVALYSILTFFVALWSLSVFFIVAPYTPFEIFKIVTKLHFFVGQLAYFFFFLFAVYHSSTRKVPIFDIIIASLINIVILGVIFFPSLFIQFRNTPIFSERIVLSQIIFPIYVAWLYVLLILGEVAIIRKLKDIQGAERKSLRNIAIGVFVAGIVGALFNAIFPFFGNFNFFALNPFIVTVAFTGVGIYTLIKYKLFNIKVITTELLTLSIWIFLLIQTLLADSLKNKFTNGVLLALIVIFGTFLIKSVLQEVKQKDRLQDLTGLLKDLNKSLQQRVAEQTMEMRKSYEMEKKTRIELEELYKTKDQFILTTQHHLRTPLTIAKGYLQYLIAKKIQLLDDEGKNYLEKASWSIDRTSILVNDLLDISRMEVGKNILNKQQTNVYELVSGIIKELSGEIQKKSISVVIDVQKDVTIDVDFVRFRDAITNIIDNAVKYNLDKGSIIIKGEKIDHPVERDKKVFRLTIENTGIGLTPEELANSFTKYFQRGKEAEKLFAVGKGVGLIVTKNIIHAHGGKVYVESEGRDKGAKFVVEMPA